MKPEYLPHAQVVRRDTRRSVERTPPAARAPRRASPPAATPALGGWGTYATIIAFGLAVCLTGYLAIGDKDRFYVGRPDVAAPAPIQARDDTAIKARPPMPSLAGETEPEFSSDVTDEHVAILESLTPAPRAIPDRNAAWEGKAPKEARAAPVATGSRKVGTVRSAPEVVRLPASRVVATQEISEPAVPDRSQQLASAISICERQNVIAGLVCTERARLQYCEGEWGVAPLCAAAVVSLNTR